MHSQNVVVDDVSTFFCSLPFVQSEGLDTFQLSQGKYVSLLILTIQEERLIQMIF